MRTSVIPTQLRFAAAAQARLLDTFIELTLAEIERQKCVFTRESLHESLETLREDRRAYGMLGGLIPVSDAA